jgi:hypothetical protein
MAVLRLATIVLFLAATLFPARAADTPETLTQDQIRSLIREAADKDVENDKKQRDYTYVEREEEHKLNGRGEVQSTESHTREVIFVYGDQIERLIAKDDKPLSDKDAAKEEERIQKIVDKRKDESESDRKKRIEKEEKDREDGRKFVKEIADAYDFRMIGTEAVNGRDAYVIDAEPHPGYEPHMKEAKFLPKFRFRVWVDKQEKQWVKLDLQCIDTVSVGLFLVRLHKGSNIQMEQTRVNDEVWLPRHVDLKIDARVALLKGLNISEEVAYRDYKKFRTDTKITPLGEVQ